MFAQDDTFDSFKYFSDYQSLVRMRTGGDRIAEGRARLDRALGGQDRHNLNQLKTNLR